MSFEHLWSPQTLPFIGALILIAINFIARRRLHEEMVRLDDASRERLYRDFSRYRMIQTSVVMLIIVMMLGASLRWNVVRGNELYVLAVAAVTIAMWFGFGYELMRKKLEELHLPESFIKAYLADRWPLAGALLLLVVMGYVTLSSAGFTG